MTILKLFTSYLYLTIKKTYLLVSSALKSRLILSYQYIGCSVKMCTQKRNSKMLLSI